MVNAFRVDGKGVRNSRSAREPNRRRRIGLLVGAAGFVALLFTPSPAGLDSTGWRTAAVATLMATWWVTEAIPIPATALVPLALFPLLGIGSIDVAAAPYAHPIIFLFLGGFIVALAMERWGLPRRIALNTLRRLGTRPAALVAGMMASSALLSMWVSNTATAMIMLPIGLAVVELYGSAKAAAEAGGAAARAAGGGNADPASLASGAQESGPNFGIGVMLGVAYGCSIGGLGTLIGTPPNAFLAAFLEESYGVEIGFAEWMLVGFPLVLVGLPLTHLLLTRVVFPLPSQPIPAASELIAGEIRKLGGMTRPERRVAVVFVATALLWIARPLIARHLPGLSDAGIAMLAALALFLVPAGAARGGALMTWVAARRLPWGMLVLFGGGLSLASAFGRTGLTDWIGAGVSSLAAWPVVLVVLASAGLVIFLTELTSNTATAAAFLPVLGAVAVGMGESPLLLAVPAALAASCAFMLPVATPPNAIVYGSGLVTIPHMARAGLLLNLLFLLLVTAAARLLLPFVFGVALAAGGGP